MGRQDSLPCGMSLLDTPPLDTAGVHIPDVSLQTFTSYLYGGASAGSTPSGRAGGRHIRRIEPSWMLSTAVMLRGGGT